MNRTRVRSAIRRLRTALSSGDIAEAEKAHLAHIFHPRQSNPQGHAHREYGEPLQLRLALAMHALRAKRRPKVKNSGFAFRNRRGVQAIGRLFYFLVRKSPSRASSLVSADFLNDLLQDFLERHKSLTVWNRSQLYLAPSPMHCRNRGSYGGQTGSCLSFGFPVFANCTQYRRITSLSFSSSGLRFQLEGNASARNSNSSV